MNTHNALHHPARHLKNADLAKEFKNPTLDTNDKALNGQSQRSYGNDADKGHIHNEHKSRRSIDIFDYSQSESSQLASKSQNCSENVADRNISSRVHSNQTRRSIDMIDDHQGHNQQHVQKQGSKDINPVEAEQHSNGASSSNYSNPTAPDHLSKNPNFAASTPVSVANTENTQSQESSNESNHSPLNEHTKKSLASIGVNLDNITDTLQHTHLAPAVTHETVQPVVHEIRHEKITRDVHNVDVYNHILPIKEVEVLPARHFIRSPSGTLSEIPAELVPEVLGTNQE